MTGINLTKGKVAIIDEEDFPRVNKYKWFFNNGYACIALKKDNKRHFVFLHKFVMGVGNKIKLDHKNGDGLDNRKSNLRLCTQSQNMANVGINSANKSGKKGVSIHNQTNKWQVYIKKNGVNKFLGLFSDIEKAADAYDVAAVKLFGEFARLNKTM